MAAKLWAHVVVPATTLRDEPDLPEIPGIIAKIHEDGERALVEASWTTWCIPDVQTTLGVVDVDRAWPKQARTLPPTLAALEAQHLRPYQRQAVEFFSLPRPGGILADAMGLGKTRTAAFAAARVAHETSRLPLIVGPKYLRSAWRDELRRVGLLDDDARFVVFEGLTVDRQALTRVDALYDDFRRTGRLAWGFIHYDVAQAWSGVLYRRFGACVVDEAHAIKSPKARRTQAVHALALSMPWRLVLTGTPMPNRPSELWSLLTVACGAKTWGSHFEFRARYCGATPGEYGWIDTGPTHVDELGARLERCYVRRTPTSEGVVLPPLTRVSQLVALDDPKTAAAIADELAGIDLAALERMLDAGIIGNEYLRALARVRKHSSRVKVPATAALVVEQLGSSSDRSVVVFAHERAMADKVARAVADEARERLAIAPTVFVVTGAMDADERARVVAQFQALPGGAVLVATYGALSVGVTLTAADVVVLHDLDWTPATLLQAEARIHRVSQARPCFSYWMVCEDGVDTLFARVLSTKACAMRDVLDDVDASNALADTRLDADA